MKQKDVEDIIALLGDIPDTKESRAAKLQIRSLVYKEKQLNEKKAEIRAPLGAAQLRSVRRFIMELDTETAARQRKNTTDWHDVFFTEIAKCGIISRAAEIAGVNYNAVNSWRSKDAKFEARFNEAKKEFSDRVEHAAIKRAIEGIEVKKFYKDQPLIDPKTGQQYTERQYSDSLLVKLLEAKKRDEYGRREKHEHRIESEVRVAGMAPEEARQEIYNRIQRLTQN